MKKIIPIFIAFLIICGCVQKTSKDMIIDVSNSGDTLTLEDIEKTIDSLNYYLNEDSSSIDN